MGQSPEFYRTYFRDYLTAQERPYTYICEQLQSPHSNICVMYSLYCIYYCYVRCRGNTLYNIVQWCQNDEYVFDFVTQKFGIKHTVY